MSDAIQLGVNIDHIATIRQARGTVYPDLAEAVAIAESAGARGITLHLREDRRHIQDADVEQLRALIQTRMNLEMAATDEMVAIASRLRPQDCCLVPERREELTTEGGLDVAGQQARLTAVCDQLRQAGVRVSLFIEPAQAQIDAAKAVGAPVIELHTGRYANAAGEAQQAELHTLQWASRYAHGLGLQVNAGHGLDYSNVVAIAAIPQLVELNIGHSIVARALFVGLWQAVNGMATAMCYGRQSALAS